MSDGHDGHHDDAPVRIEPGSEDERILNSVLHPGGEHHADRFFFWIFIWLAIITVAELFVTVVEMVALNRFLLIGLGVLKFALVVMYDATGVRQAAGKQAKVLNQILRELFTGQPVSEEELKELIGHTPTEVYVGALVGVLYTVLWYQLSP